MLFLHDQSASTSSQIGTHADSLIAEAVLKNISYGFDPELAWEAVWKDAIFGPIGDGEIQYADREEVCFEPRIVSGNTDRTKCVRSGFVSFSLLDRM